MNNPSRHSTISELKKRVPMLIAIMILAGAVALNVFIPEPVLSPDTVHPMANARISWQQTFYCGPWGEAE